MTDGATETRQVHIFGVATNVPTTFCQQQSHQQQPPMYHQPPMQTHQQAPMHHNQTNAITLVVGSKPHVQRKKTHIYPIGEAS